MNPFNNPRPLQALLIGAVCLSACAQPPIVAPATAVVTPAPTETTSPTLTPIPTSTVGPTATASPTTPPEPYFAVYGDGPIVTKGPAGAWDDRFTDPGAVVYHDGLFHMFRNGFRDWPASVQVGYVTSPDGYSWTKQGDEPLLKTEDISYAGVAALASSVIVEDDGTWVLYFYTWQSRNYPSAGGIGRATAHSPIGPFTPDPDLVLKPGSSSAWDGSHVLAPHVLKTETGYVMYYSGYNRKGSQWIGMAASSDGIHWDKYNDPATTDAPLAESDPVLRPDPDGEWSQGWVHQPRVFQTDSGWAMLYRATESSRNAKMAIGLATSTDGIHWTHSPRNPLLTAKAIKRAQYFWFTNALYQDETLFLFWEVDINQSTEIYLAVHRGPLQ